MWFSSLDQHSSVRAAQGSGGASPGRKRETHPGKKYIKEASGLCRPKIAFGALHGRCALENKQEKKCGVERAFGKMREGKIFLCFAAVLPPSPPSPRAHTHTLTPGPLLCVLLEKYKPALHSYLYFKTSYKKQEG